MKLKIVTIDFRMPAWARWGSQAAAVVLVLGVGVAAAAPQAFTKNEPLGADKMNKNFTDLDTRLTALTAHPVVARNGKQYSLGATYCGKTAAIAGTAIGGYASAKTLCESGTACGTAASAHMCTSEELTRSAQMSIASGTGWFSTGAYSTINTPAPVRDCLGWAASAASEVGATWDGNGPSGVTACTTPLPVLCCD